MTLPAGVLTGCTICVGLSTSGTAYVDWSDYISVVEMPEGARITGGGHVFGEDVPIVTTGKREALEWRVRGVYVDTTATTNPFNLFWTAYTSDCGGPLYIRTAPAGCATTNNVFSSGTATTDQSELMSLKVFDGADASAGDPLMYEAVIRSAQMYRATYAA